MQNTESLSVEWRAIGEIRPYPGNPRKFTAVAVAKLAAVLKEYGWRQPIVVDEAGEIIIGHRRWLAARKLRWKRVPVHVAAGLTGDQVRALRLADNRVHEDAEWDRAALEIELKALDFAGFDLQLTAFDRVELPSEPVFVPASEPTSPPLDRLTDVMCPACQHVFQMGSRR